MKNVGHELFREERFVRCMHTGEDNIKVDHN
jgi:hypothetical protein